MSLNDPHLQETFQYMIDERKRKVKIMMKNNKFSDVKNPAMDDSLKHLDKIIKILRTKKKFIFIEKKTNDDQS